MAGLATSTMIRNNCYEVKVVCLSIIQEQTGGLIGSAVRPKTKLINTRGPLLLETANI